MNEEMNEWIYEWMNEWINEWMNEWMNECVNGLLSHVYFRTETCVNILNSWPYNGRERRREAKLIIRMNQATTTIVDPEDGNEKNFTFDFRLVKWYIQWFTDEFIYSMSII